MPRSARTYEGGLVVEVMISVLSVVVNGDALSGLDVRERAGGSVAGGAGARA